MTFHLSFLEVSWFIGSCLVCLISFVSYRDAIIDSAFLIAANINGPRKIVAAANIRQELKRLVIGAVMLLASGASLFLEPPPPGYFEFPQMLVTLLAWNIISITIFLSSILDRTARKKLQEYAPVSVQEEVAQIEPGGDITQRAEKIRHEH